MSSIKQGTFKNLDIIRHKDRPVFNDYVPLIFKDFIELKGDRCFSNDYAICAGLARINGVAVTLIGQVKGKNLEQNKKANFSMSHPEGYRKVMRLIKQAEKFDRPVITFIDTPGAYCGVEAEERGQGSAIAQNIKEFMFLKVPIISVIIGEGGSGGALGVCVCDKMAMLSNAIFSVISPKGFASIVWKNPEKEREAAEIMKITANDLLDFGIIDQIISEPEKGAHSDIKFTSNQISSFLKKALSDIRNYSYEEIINLRHKKYRNIEFFKE